MQKFRIGMNIRDVITAANMNEIADAVNAVKENQNNLPTRQIGGRTYQTGEIRIKFSDSGTLDRFAAVALTGLELTAENCDTFSFEVPTFTAGKVTAARKDMPFAICLEPANSGELSKALVTGVTPAKVTIRDAAHQYAQPIPDSSTGALESCESGTARILFKSGGSGEQWCILQLGSGGSGSVASGYANYFAVEQTENGVRIFDGGNPESTTAGLTDVGAVPVATITGTGSLYLNLTYENNAYSQTFSFTAGTASYLIADVLPDRIIQRWTGGMIYWRQRFCMRSLS